MRTHIKNCCRPAMYARGVSLVEVLFAMMIALFGLAGVLAIIPLASRQASDSYQLNHATNGALSASAISSATDSILPSDKAPWIIVDDQVAMHTNAADPLQNRHTNAHGIHPYKRVSKLDDVYVGLQFLYPAFNSTQKLNVVTGQGFCFDPLYVSYVNQQNWIDQGKAWDINPGAGIFRPTRFPFFKDLLNLDTTSGQFSLGSVATPRLIRVSSLGSRNIALPFPLGTSAAESMVSQLGDLVQASIQEDKSYGALREFEGADSGMLLSAAAKSDLSWFATLVPRESKGTEFPSNFKVSIVLLSKRDRSFDVPDRTAVVDELPRDERVAFVSAMGAIAQRPESMGSILNTTFHFDNRSDAELRIGNYVMLSRFVIWNAAGGTRPEDRKYVHRHFWYRIVGVSDVYDTDLSTGSPQISRDVVLQGQPWDYPDLNNNINGTGAGLPAVPTNIEVSTIATIMDNVVAVYEYPVDLR